MRSILSVLKIGARTYPEVLKYKLFGIPTPIIVIFAVTNKCNLKCDYCFVSPEERANKELPTEKLLDFIDQFIDLGTVFFDLHGGEPTLRPDLGTLISHIIERGARCTLATNGFRVDKHLECLKKCYSVCVSIDGLAETTDAHRGKGAYEVALKALDIVSGAGINVRIHGVITSITTCSDIDHLVALAKKYNAYVNFAYALDTGLKKTGSNVGADFVGEGLKKIAAYVYELKKRNEPINSRVGAIRQILNWPYSLQDILFENEMSGTQKREMKRLSIPRCLWGRLFCYFNPEGKLYLCARGFDREDFSVEIGNRSIREAFYELAGLRSCYMCGQMGDLNYFTDLNLENILALRQRA